MALTCFVVAYGSQTHETDAAHTADEAADHVKHEAGAHWTYEGETGPEHWASVKEDFVLCGSGQEQSPIDLTEAGAEDLTDIVVEYQASSLSLVNNGHTIQANYAEGSSIEVDGTSYDLLQLHFHTPSEHTVDGASFPMEMHLVHSADGKLAVIGVLMSVGEAHVGLQPLVDAIPSTEGETSAPEGGQVDAAELLPEDRSVYRYPGSLTTPPCSEGVVWSVIAAPIRVSQEQVDAFQSVIDVSNRPVQPLNARTLDL